MSEDKIREMCNDIYEGGYWEPMIDLIQSKDKEIERLNNIINELEKYCNEEIEDYDKAISSKILSEIGRDKYEAEKTCFLDMLDKLQELKVSDKE